MKKEINNIDYQLFVVKAAMDYSEHEIRKGDILIVDDSELETELLCVHIGRNAAGIIAKNEVTEWHHVLGGVVERIRSYSNVVCEV